MKNTLNTIKHISKAHKLLVISFTIFFLFSVTIRVFATPPTSPYQAGNTLDPTCAPGDTNCFVEILASQTGNSGKFLTTDGTSTSWAATISSAVLNNSTLDGTITLDDFKNAGAILFTNSSGLVTQDTANFVWDDTNNRLGVGTSSPEAKLHTLASSATDIGQIIELASGQSANAFEINSFGGSGGNLVKVASTGAVTFSDTTKTEQIRITGDALEFSRSSKASFATGFQGQGNSLDLNVRSDFSIKSNSNLTYFVNESYHSWGDSTSERMRLTGGNLGIGTTTPNAKLHVIDGTGQMQVASYATGFMNLSLNGSGSTTDYNFTSSISDKNLYINRPSGYDIDFRVNNSAIQMVIKSTGNVGIGTSSPGEKLQVAGAIKTSGALTTWLASSSFLSQEAAGAMLGVAGPDASTRGTISLYTATSTGANGITALRIDNAGNVGIGTTSPTAKLHTKATSASDIVGIFQGTTSQSGNLTEWRNVSDTVLSSVDASGNIHLDNGGYVYGDTTSQYLRLSNSTGTILAYNSSNYISHGGRFDVVSGGISSFSVRSSKVTSAAPVYIGGFDTTPSAQLHVVKTTEQLRLGYDASNYWTNTIGASGALTMQGVGTGGSLTLSPTSGQNLNVSLATTGDFIVNTNQFVVDTSAGNVGIGLTSPGTKLDVVGVARATTLRSYNETVGANLFQASNNGSTGWKFDNGGGGNSYVTLNGFNVNTQTILFNPAGDSYINSSNVGIGTTSPTAKLHLNSGNIKVGSFTTGGGVSDEAIITEKTLRASGGLNMRPPTVGDSAFYGIRMSGNDIAIAAGNSDVFKIASNGTVGTNTATLTRTYNPVVGSGQISNIGSNFIIGSSDASTADFNNIYLTANINQTGSHTSVTRGIYISPTLTSAVDFRAIQTTGGSLKMADSYLAGSGSKADSLLDLTQTWNTTGAPTAIKLNVTNTASNSASALMDLQTDSSSKFFVGVDGNVGIQNTAPAYTLHAGNSSTSGIVARFENSTGTCDINPTTTSLSCSSDINLKKNITTLDGTDFILNIDSEIQYATNLDKLLALNVVTYNWNTEDDTANKHIGFIAQQVESVYPDLVTTDINTGLKSLNLTNLIPYTIAGIQQINVTLTGIQNLEEETDFLSNLRNWLASASNGVEEIFTRKIKTQNLCVSDENGFETCITKSQLDYLLSDAGASSNQNNNPPPQDPPQESPQEDVNTDEDTPTDEETIIIDENDTPTEEPEDTPQEETPVNDTVDTPVDQS